MVVIINFNMKTLRQNIIRNAKKIVIKVGTNVLTDKSGILDRIKISNLVNQLAFLVQDQKKQVILVSSGAIGAGMGKLKLEKRPKSLPEIQALAAIGQSILIEAYRNGFNRHGIEIGQILVTREDFQNRTRYLNISNTLASLMAMKIIPIFNENDTVSTREITFGDNDQLSVLVSHAIHADLTVILSSTNGLLDMENGRTRIEYVEQINSKILSKVTSEKSSRGAGGMKSKIQAIKQLTQAGEAVILANGNDENPLLDIFALKELGTFFKPREMKLKRKKKWIAFSAKTGGDLLIDEGARSALLKNSSLLAIGIRDIRGKFSRGDIVKITCGGQEIARGLVNYSSEALLKIKGLRSPEIREILDGEIYEEVIHKDNLVITAEEEKES